MNKDSEYDRIRSLCEKWLEDYDEDADTLLGWLEDDL